MSWDCTTKEHLEDDEEFPSYPGVRAVYLKQISEGNVKTTDKKILTHLGLMGESTTSGGG